MCLMGDDASPLRNGSLGTHFVDFHFGNENTAGAFGYLLSGRGSKQHSNRKLSVFPAAVLG